MTTLLSLGNLAELQRYLNPIAYKWYNIGLQLGLDPVGLEAVKSSNQTDGGKLIEILQQRLKDLQPITWEGLCKVLEGGVVGEPRLAQTIRQQKVPTPSTPTEEPFRFPDSLEIQQLKARLEGESQTIRLQFGRLVNDTLLELRQQNITHKSLILTLVFYDNSLKGVFNTASTIEDVFYIANDYWSFFNYDLLKYIIDTLQLINVNMDWYIAHFQDYCRRRLFECRSEVAGAHSDAGRRVVMKLDDRMNMQISTMEDIRSLQHQASKITGIRVMQLLRIEDGCLNLIYRVAHKAIETINFLSPEKKKELAEIGILSMSCEKKILRWVIENDDLKSPMFGEDQCIKRDSLSITELAEYETNIELTLKLQGSHFKINADVEISDETETKSSPKSDKIPPESDKIQVKVIPAIHQEGMPTATLPLIHTSNSLHSFEINGIISLYDIMTANSVEFYIEVHIESHTRPKPIRQPLTDSTYPTTEKLAQDKPHVVTRWPKRYSVPITKMKMESKRTSVPDL